MNESNLILGDCRQKLTELPDCSVDLVLCDMPYAMTPAPWDNGLPLGRIWAELNRCCKPNAAILLHSHQVFTYALIDSNPADFKYRMVWIKTLPTAPMLAKRQPMRKFEEVCVFYRTPPTFNRPIENGKPKALFDVLEFKAAQHEQGGKSHHPNQKPTELLRHLIRVYSNKGETVLDFTMGSGSTGVAAMLEGRKFVGIERDEHYFKVATERITQAAGQ